MMKNVSYWVKPALVLGLWLLSSLSGHCFWNSAGRGDELAVADAGGSTAALRAMSRANPIRFSTKHRDKSDQVYYGYRYYNASTGRWLSRDPVEEKGGENLYAFVRNAPIDEIDPVGFAACKSNYKWIVQPPMKDRDLLSAQMIWINTTFRVGADSQIVSRPMPLYESRSRYGLTITEPSLVGGDCCCSSSGGYKPTFDLIVHSQIYLLDKGSSAWGVDRVATGDPDVDEYWYHSSQWHRLHLAMKHESKHQAHGKKNYETWKADLEAGTRNTYSSMELCLQAVAQALRQTWGKFNIAEQADVNALHKGGRAQ